MGLIQGTTYVLADEPCYRLDELNLQSPGSKGFRRYQILWVIRDDKLTEYREKLGDTKDFTSNEFHIMGGGIDEETGRGFIEETVGSLKSIADWKRSVNLWDKLDLAGTNNIKTY